MVKETLFSKIIAGELPSTKIYEDDDFLVIQDLYQAGKGHSLIILKEYSEDILSTNIELGTKILAIIQKIGRAVMQGLQADGFHVMINAKPVASHVPHTHIHIIPRYEGDGVKDFDRTEADEEQRLLLAQKIISALD